MAASIVALSNHPALDSHIASSNNIEEMTFAPGTPITSQLNLRKALSLSISRQSMIDTLFGSVTFSPSVAASAIYSQGQSQYPGPSGSNPAGQTTTTTTTPAKGSLVDCQTLRAVADLRDAGLHRTSAGWIDGSAKPLTIVLGVGSSVLDHAVAKLVVADWKSIGIRTAIVNETSDVARRARRRDGSRRRRVVCPSNRDQSLLHGAVVGGSAVSRYLSEWRANRERDDTLW